MRSLEGDMELLTSPFFYYIFIPWMFIGAGICYFIPRNWHYTWGIFVGSIAQSIITIIQRIV